MARPNKYFLATHGVPPRAVPAGGDRWLLWRATHDGVHLVKAKRLLDEALANVAEQYHESMLTNVRVNREILAAWREEFGDEGPDEPAGGGSEAATQAG